MSHFFVTVFLPAAPTDRGDAEQKVNDLLAPYDENLSVLTYEEPCWCVGHEANNEVRKQLGDTSLRFSAVHEKWNALGVDLLMEKGTPEQREAYDDELDSVQADIEEERARLWAAHPGKDKVDPACEECHGSGRVKTDRNPRAKWDWWSIGGRWTGVFTQYKPDEDPANVETCYLCQGTGMRNDELGRAERMKNPEYTCNGCEGTGKRVKWPTEWRKYEGDVVLGSVLPEDFSCYAVVTPDGVWHERGEMGWWACSHNVVRPEVWKERIKQLITENRQNWAVAVDCHI